MSYLQDKCKNTVCWTWLCLIFLTLFLHPHLYTNGAASSFTSDWCIIQHISIFFVDCPCIFFRCIFFRYIFFGRIFFRRIFFRCIFLAHFFKAHFCFGKILTPRKFWPHKNFDPPKFWPPQNFDPPKFLTPK